MQCCMLAEGSNESSLRHCKVVSKSLGVPGGFLACYAHTSSLIAFLRYLSFIGSDCIFLVQYTVQCLQRVYNELSLRHCTVVSKSPGVLGGFLACHAHPSSLISLLRYFGFIVSDCI